MMKNVWFIPLIAIVFACSEEKKEVSPLQPPSDEEVVKEEEKGFFESAKKELPEEKEKVYKTEFDENGMYWLSEAVNVDKYSIHSLSLLKNEGATLTLEVEETAEMVDLTTKKYLAKEDTFSVSFPTKTLGTITITGHFITNPWSKDVEENETVVLKGKIKAGSEAAKNVEFTWNAF